MYALRITIAILLFSSIALAQQAKISAATCSEPAEKLLEQSYRISADFPIEERAMYLTTLASRAAELHSPNTGTWARELWRLSFTLPMDWNRIATEKNALTALSGTDPDEAMSLFRSLDKPVPTSNGSIAEDVRSYAARTIFSRYWARHGKGGLPEIRRNAAFLTSTGQYPFDAMAPIVNTVAKTGDKHLAGQLCREAIEGYTRGSNFLNTNQEFWNFLRAVRAAIPDPLFREGVTQLLTNLSRGEKAEEGVVTKSRVETKTGVAEFSSVSERLMYEVLLSVRELDPQWADRLLEQNPGLKRLDRGEVVASADFAVMGAKNAAEAEPVLARLTQEAQARKAVALASTDPAQANALAAQLTEPDLRISAYSAIAAGLPASEHSRAADLLRSQFREAHKIENPGRRLTAYLGLARAAKASGETQITRDAIRSGLDSGEEAFAEERDIHPSELTYRMLPFRELAWLVELCAQTDPEWIVPHLHTMDDPALQAYLLLSAGKGLYERECTPTEH